MPLTKTVLDIDCTAGLSQKFDANLAPNGVSLQALNLVKNKRNTLQKRIGFTSLNKFNEGDTFLQNVGLNLGTHLEKLVAFGSGPYFATGQQVSTVSSYSDSAAVTTPQHIIPEVLVKPRQYSVSVDNTAYECDCYSYNDYIFLLWTATVSTGTNRELFYCIIEASTNNVLVPATVLNAGDTYAIRVFTVGTFVIVTYLDVATGNIVATKWSAAAPTSGFTSSNIMATIFATGDSYDADVVAGDSLNFALLYQGARDTLVINVVSVASLAITSHTTIIDASYTGMLHGAGLYGDTTTNSIAVAYSYVTGGDTAVGSAVAAGWPTLSGTCNGATMFAPLSGFPLPPMALAVAPLGLISTGGGGNAYSWGVWFGTPGCNLSGTGFDNDGTVTSAASLPFTYFYSFFEIAGAPTNSVLRQTLGCVPVSRAIVQNGVPYVLVYVPSGYQGSYYLCAADYFATPADPEYYPLRPVGTIAPRQCLSDSPLYVVDSVPGGFKIVNGTWTSLGIVPLNVTKQASVVGSTRTMTHIPIVNTLPYSTAALVVMTTPIGRKQIPTLYEVEFNSRHMYQSTMHGRSLAFAGGVPSVYDGVQSVEIGFCYYPEVRPINSSLGSPNFINKVSSGPTFNEISDIYNYIVTYEWVDAQGQTHISARSPVITISGDMVSSALGLGVTFISSVGSGTASASSITVTESIAAGDIIVVGFMSTAVTSPTDTDSNAYTSLNITNGPGNLICWGTITPNAALGGTLVITPPATSTWVAYAHYRSTGTPSFGSATSANTYTGASSVPDPGSLTLATAGQTVVVFSQSDAVPQTAGAGYTLEQAGSNTTLSVQDLMGAGIGAQSTAFGSKATTWQAVAVTINPGTEVVGAFPVTVNIKLYIPSLGLGYRVLPHGASVTGPQSLDGGGEKVTIGLYRGVVNGSVYYKISDPENIGDSSALAAGTIQNNTAGTYQVILTDQTNDITTLVPGGEVSFYGAQAQQPLYDDGTDGTNGNLDNFNPPSSSIICEHKNRIFLADGPLVWYSKALTPTEAPAFNETSMLFSVGDQSPITGFASMDDKLIIFKRKKIYYITGDGPLDNGAQNNFSDPQPIPTEIGCNDPRGISVTPDGTYFMSDAGYRMLDRSLTVQYTGTAVENELQEYTYVTASVLHPSTNRLILCANVSDVTTQAGSLAINGEFLYYDYVLDAWTNGIIQTFAGEGIKVNDGPQGAGIGLAPRALGYEPTLHFIMANGKVWRENDPASAAPYLDNAGWYNSVLECSWIKPANSYDGFARCWAVDATVVPFDTCDVSMTVQTDYGATTQTNQRTLTAASSLQPSIAFPIETYLQNQRCAAFNVTITMLTPTTGPFTTGQGVTIIGLTADIGTYPATDRAIPGNRQ